jgi:molybdate transport system regulatory protein
VKIVAENKGQVGPGKIALLKAIDAHGSISAAARAVDMSYRRAWLLVEEIGAAVGAPVVETHIGGAKKGGTVLNDKGRKLIALYDRIEAKANKAVDDDLKSFFAKGNFRR